MAARETISRVLNMQIDRMKEGIERCEIQQRRMPYDHDNNNALIQLRGYKEEYEKALEYIQTDFKHPAEWIIARLLGIADAFQEGGHKSRAAYFRAVAKEMEIKFL